MGPDGIPKWSTPSVAQRVRSVPPPTNIQVTVINDPVIDTENKVMEVIARVQWELPVLDDGRNSKSDMQQQRRQQSDGGGESQTGSGIGEGQPSDNGDVGGGEEVVPVQIGELTNIFIYMGTTPLDRFTPRPEENVQELKVHV